MEDMQAPDHTCVLMTICHNRVQLFEVELKWDGLRTVLFTLKHVKTFDSVLENEINESVESKQNKQSCAIAFSPQTNRHILK